MYMYICWIGLLVHLPDQHLIYLVRIISTIIHQAHTPLSASAQYMQQVHITLHLTLHLTLPYLTLQLLATSKSTLSKSKSRPDLVVITCEMSAPYPCSSASGLRIASLHYDKPHLTPRPSYPSIASCPPPLSPSLSQSQSHSSYPLTLVCRRGEGS